VTAPPSSFHPSPRRPAGRLPPGACDAHVHVFGPHATFPFAAGRSYTPCEAPKERLFALHDHLGIERCVVVQSNAHGFDNAATADAIAARRGRYVGIALVPLTVDDRELVRLAAVGFRGVRFNFARHLGNATPIADVVAFGARLAAHGLHLQVYFESALVHDLAPALARSPVPVVIDHMGRVDAALGVDHPDFRAVRRLLRLPHVWVKVSGAERISRLGPPYADAVPFARALLDDAPERVLWGSDWPHPNLGHVPDDGELVDLIRAYAPDERERQALLVDNPARLYRFGEAA
jgi:2-pyrone-4,6-dicarboxylate lactonase